MTATASPRDADAPAACGSPGLKAAFEIRPLSFACGRSWEKSGIPSHGFGGGATGCEGNFTGGENVGKVSHGFAGVGVTGRAGRPLSGASGSIAGGVNAVRRRSNKDGCCGPSVRVAGSRGSRAPGNGNGRS